MPRDILKDELRARIIDILRDVAEQGGTALSNDFDDDSVLLESGLDSLGFAIAVARLEIELGYDPFRSMAQPVYPRTLREFVECFESFRQQ